MGAVSTTITHRTQRAHIKETHNALRVIIIYSQAQLQLFFFLLLAYLRALDRFLFVVFFTSLLLFVSSLFVFPVSNIELVGSCGGGLREGSSKQFEMYSRRRRRRRS